MEFEAVLGLRVGATDHVSRTDSALPPEEVPDPMGRLRMCLGPWEHCIRPAHGASRRQWSSE
eukprot:10737509-Alexandrium_andersonii.AAC.1